MRRRIRELVALMLAVCMICGGIWIGKSAAYAAEVTDTYTLTWMDYENDVMYTVETYKTEQLEDRELITLPEDPTKPGYVFLGWCGYEGGFDYGTTEESVIYNVWEYGVRYKQENKSDFESQGIRMRPEPLRIYAYWQAIRYEISYSGGEDVSGIPETVHGIDDPIYYQDEVILSEEIPSRSGYTFSGWEYDGTVYPAGETFIVPDAPYQTVEGDYEIYMAYITLTASWTPNQHTITYDGNGAASGVPAAQQAGYETTVTAAAAPVREGYTFTGWLSSTGETYPAGGTFTMPDSDVTLTAQWEVANTGGISSAGSYYLLRGQPYSLNGVTKTERDEGVYAGGITFYVPSDGYYTFTE